MLIRADKKDGISGGGGIVETYQGASNGRWRPGCRRGDVLRVPPIKVFRPAPKFPHVSVRGKIEQFFRLGRHMPCEGAREACPSGGRRQAVVLCPLSSSRPREHMDVLVN